MTRALPVLPVLALLAGCAFWRGGDGEPETLRFVIGPATAAEQEAVARRLAACPPPVSDPDGWPEWELGDTGVRLRLPPGYVRLEDAAPPDPAIWEGPDSSLIVVGVHPGDGLTTTLAQPAAPAETGGSGHCRATVAGRQAVIIHSWSRVGGTTYYHASTDVEVHDGLGVGAAVLGFRAEHREAFMAALSTLTVAPEPRRR